MKYPGSVISGTRPVANTNIATGIWLTQDAMQGAFTSSWPRLTPPTAPPGSQTFNYVSDADQSFTVPSGYSFITVKMWGAGGGSNRDAGAGGGGGYTTSVLSVTSGEVLTVRVGRGGLGSGLGTSETSASTGNPLLGGTGGWPGGGTGGSSTSYGGGGGGGGYYGGGNASFWQGGGGGSGYVTGSGSTTAGSGTTPGNSGDADRGTAGQGAPAGGTGENSTSSFIGIKGRDGRLIISWS